MVNQKFKEYRVNSLPNSNLSAGDRYYLNVGKKQVMYIVSDSLELIRDNSSEFIEKDTMQEMRNLSTREIWALQNNIYKGVKLKGYYTEGDTRRPIEYYVTSTSELDDGGSVIATGGIKLKHKFKSTVESSYFGVKADGIKDDWLSLQTCIEFAIVNKLAKVYLPSGTIKISKSLLIGNFVSGVYSYNGYYTLVISGEISPYKGESFGGTTILCDFSDRMGINVQGARTCDLIGFSIIGKLNKYLELIKPLANRVPTFEDTVLANWIDPDVGTESTLLKRYAPYAGITVDAYNGTKPMESSYPDYIINGVNTSLYNSLPGSTVRGSKIQVIGFGGGIVYNPSNLDNNGDFMAIGEVEISNCLYGVSYCATQGRQMNSFKIKIFRCFNALNNNKFGKQQGTIDGEIDSFYTAYCVNVFDFDAQWMRSLLINNMSGELVYDLGVIQSGGSTAGSLSIVSGNFTLTARSIARGVNPFILRKVGAGVDMPISLKNVIFSRSEGLIMFGSNVYLENVSSTPDSYPDFINWRLLDSFKSVNNVYKNIIKGLFLRNQSDTIGQNTCYQIKGDNTLGITIAKRNQDINDSDRDYLISYYNNAVVGKDGSHMFYNKYFTDVITGPNIGSTSWTSTPTSLKLNLTYPASHRAIRSQASNGFGVGDLVISSINGFAFIVESYNETTFEAVWRAITNYKLVDGNLVSLTPNGVATDNFYSQSCKHYMPNEDTYFSATEGNSSLTDIITDYTPVKRVPQNVFANDYIFASKTLGGFFKESGMKINSIDASARTFTMSTTAQRTGFGRLGKIVRII